MVVLLFATAVASCASVGLSRVERFDERVAALSTETDAIRRMNGAVELIPLAHAIADAGDAGAIHERTVQQIASWLDNPGEEFGACALLSEIGHRANFAVPMVDGAIARIGASRADRGSIHGAPDAEIGRLQQCRAAIGG